MRQQFIAIFIVVIAGCGPVDDSHDPLPKPNYDDFVDIVQPILIDGCGNPSSCHGSSQRPFSLYVPGAHRENPAHTFTSDVLTLQEKRANYDRARSFIVDIGGGPLLLTKPLAERAGGVRHGDIEALYFSKEERDYHLIEAWIDGAADTGRTR